MLLVGGLSPLSTAAPHRSRATMERQKRAANNENDLWGNPCDYNEANAKSTNTPSAEVNEIFIKQARYAQSNMEEYKDTFAKLHSYNSFDKLIKEWTEFEWLRKFNLPEEVLPKEKQLHKPMPEEYMNELMKKIDVVLPSMYKALKLVVAGLYSFSNEGLNENIISDGTLKKNIYETMHAVRAVLCSFSDIMKARNLEIMPLPNSEIPDFKNDDKLIDGLLLFRDTQNYLEYLVQVFQKLNA